MKSIRYLVLCIALAPLALHAPLLQADTPPLLNLRPVPFSSVRIADAFWHPRQETNRLVSIPVNFHNLEQAGNLENLRLAARRATNGYRGPVFMDSDVYKAMEAAAYSLALHPDPALEKQLDQILALITAAQLPDGYLNSFFTVKRPDRRWTNLRDAHELYCAGHLFEAAVAHFEATGKRTLLEVACRLADHIDSVFGPPPKRLGYPGHPEIELALVKLWRATGERRYFDLARFFVENRGRGFFASERRPPDPRYDPTYYQDDVPIFDHDRIKGHAVRAAYLMAGVTDVAAETRDERLLRMLQRVWRNTVERNLYLTGGIGPSAHNEGFTTDYDLPNRTAYQETCATIALALWAHRLALLHGDAQYADVMERALYNGMLAGVSQDGRAFFYVNPLESRGDHHRKPWYGCACCPPNVARTLAALGGYVAATGPGALWINLYIAGELRAQLDNDTIRWRVATEYPWDGRVRLRAQLPQPGSFQLRLRVPGWCDGATVSVNGRRISQPTLERGYFVLTREWQNGDSVELNFPMPVQRILAHPHVKANQGLVALQRGPVVYCLEQCDQTVPLDHLFLPPDADIQPVVQPRLLGGVTVLRGETGVVAKPDWGQQLYQPLRPPKRVPFTAIPYYAWDNRQPGAMKVWLPLTPPLWSDTERE